MKTKSPPSISCILTESVLKQTMTAESWRTDVLEKLRQRNRTESGPFASLIDLHSKSFEKAATLQRENAQLVVLNEQLRRSQGSAAGAEFKSLEDVEEVSKLSAKVLKLQEELTELHKRKGENAQQVIDLTAQVKSLEVTLSLKSDKLRSCELQLQEMERLKERNRQVMEELQKTNELLKDEYTTLQLALSSAEKKLVEAQKENDRLVAQVIELKERDVAYLNMQNDIFNKQKQEMVRQQLEEAAKEPKRVLVKETSPVKGQIDSLICYSVRVPTRAYLKFEAHDSDINAINWSPHGLLVATGGADRKIKLWDISKGTHAECKGILSGSNGAVMSIDFDASGSYLLASSSSDFTSRVWSLQDMRLRHTLTGHSAKIFSAKFMEGGESNRVCTGSHDRTLKVWDLKSKACINTLYPGSSCNDLACFDQMIISGHFDKKVRFYDPRVGNQPTNEILLDGRVTSVDLSKNGNHVLACSRADTLSLIDLRSMSSTVSTYQADGFRVGCDWTRAVFSPDSEYVSAGSSDGSVFIWKVSQTGGDVCERKLSEHNDVVVAVAWQPAGNSMTTCDKNKTVVVWADI